VQFVVTNGQLAATWSTLPDHDALDASVFAFSTDVSTFWFHDVAVSAAFVAATGLTSIPFDVAIPGYRLQWHVDYAKEYSVDLAALRHAGNDTAASSASRDVNMPSSARVRARRRKGW
jgi:hypothetical protein